jgi:5-methyltetrahydrofolate--homocysteine methyltransferase
MPDQAAGRIGGEVAIQEIIQSVLEGDEDRTRGFVQAELSAGTTPSEILNNGLIGAMDEAGRRMSTGEMFIPEILVAADAMKAGLTILKPLLAEGDSGMRGTVVIGAVKGDLHDIGKNLVALMMEGAGFEVIDLGVDVAPESFVESAQANRADIVGMSALLVTTMPQMDVGVRQLRAAGSTAKIIVGGAPINQLYADKIHADGYASDAAGAVSLVRRLLG